MDIQDKNKLDFLLVENTQVLGNYQYILSIEHPMPMFQVITFETDADIQLFFNANPYTFIQIPHYRIVISLCNTLLNTELNKENAFEMAQIIRKIMNDAYKWFLQYKEYKNNPKFEPYKID